MGCDEAGWWRVKNMVGCLRALPRPRLRFKVGPSGPALLQAPTFHHRHLERLTKRAAAVTGVPARRDTQAVTVIGDGLLSHPYVRTYE